MATDEPHVVRAAGTQLWKDVCLRSTGFPARLLQGTVATESVPKIDAALAAEAVGGATMASCAAELEAAFQADLTRTGAFLREVARMPRFREAVLWQNRGAVLSGMDKLGRSPAGATNRDTRKFEQLVAKYLQRYCTKNDTIGFFGPVGWATLDANLASARVAPGPQLLGRRTVYFEHWAIDALAGKLSEERALRIFLPPRRMPTVRLEGARLHHSLGRVNTLPDAAVRLLEACDGERSAQGIAEELTADPASGFDSVDEVYDLLDELVEAHVVLWRLEVPTSGFHPESHVWHALASVPPGPAREAAHAAMVELCVARDRVAAAAGDDATLESALGELEETFVRLTQTDATRKAGRTYAGRGIVFEDCRRDVNVVLGRPFLDRVGPPLAMIAASARWFSHTLATRFRDVFAQVHRLLATELGDDDVDLMRFYCELRSHLSGQAGEVSPTVAEVQADLQRRWADVLALPAGASRVELTVAELAPRIAEAFGAPGPGWPSARHHSPDLMIAAAGPDALARGEFLVVLGEVHSAVNAVTVPALSKEHHEPEGLHEARAREVGRSIAPVEPRARFHRALTYSLAEGDIDLEIGDARSARPRAQVHDVAGFVVCVRDGQLRACRRDGSVDHDLIAFLETNLMAEVFSFDLFGDAEHRPRVTVDGFVLARERWRFATASMEFASRTTPFERFVEARRWATARQLPRFTFVKARGEPKPMFLDLESPVFVEIFCKLARAHETLAITEMLPDFEHLWLVDGDGATYCSELRMALVDDVAWTPPSDAPPSS